MINLPDKPSELVKLAVEISKDREAADKVRSISFFLDEHIYAASSSLKVLPQATTFAKKSTGQPFDLSEFAEYLEGKGL